MCPFSPIPSVSGSPTLRLAHLSSFWGGRFCVGYVIVNCDLYVDLSLSLHAMYISMPVTQITSNDPLFWLEKTFYWRKNKGQMGSRCIYIYNTKKGLGTTPATTNPWDVLGSSADVESLLILKNMLVKMSGLEKDCTLRILKDPPMEGWMNLYESQGCIYRSSKWRQAFEGSGFLTLIEIIHLDHRLLLGVVTTAPKRKQQETQVVKVVKDPTFRCYLFRTATFIFDSYFLVICALPKN